MKAKDVLNEDWQKVNKKDKTDGMSRKAVNAYRRENPGSKLKTAVTTKPSKLKKGSKASKRRGSYCSRSKGQMDMHNISCAKTPDKAICKARRRWNCEEDIQQVEQALEEAKKTLRNSNPCWKGYKPVGTKKKGGRTVPNCVPTNEAFQNDEANLMYRYDTASGRVKQRMIDNLDEREAHSMGFRDSVEKALRVHNIIRSKFDPNKFVQKQGTSWVPVYPFGKPEEKKDSEPPVAEGKTQKQEPPKPRNFVAKNATTSGAGAHKDKKKAEKQGDVKHKGKVLDMAEDAEPMDREFALVKKLGRLGERIVQNSKLWDKYSEAVESDDPDWVVSLIQDGTGATYEEVLRLSDLFGEIGGGMGRIIDFAWAVKEGTWEKDFLNPYRQHRSKWDMAEALKDGTQGNVKHKGNMLDLAEMEEILEKASRKLCKSSTPDEDLGASNLASCKSQGLRARDGEKSHKLGKSPKSRVTVGGHRIKGRKYGGPLPDWS